MSKPRSYVSNFTIHFGPATTTGRLLPIRMPDKSPKLHYCTQEGEPVKQCYIDENGKTYFIDELGRATMDDDGNLVQVNSDAIQDAKTSDLPLNVINLTAHSSEEIEQLLKEAQNDFQEAIRLDPNFTKGYINLACVLDLLGNYPKSIGTILELPKDKQNTTWAKRILAIAYFHDKQENKANAIWNELKM